MLGVGVLGLVGLKGFGVLGVGDGWRFFFVLYNSGVFFMLFTSIDTRK